MTAPRYQASASQCLQHAQLEFIAMLNTTGSAFLTIGNSEWLRGIDYYPASHLLHVIATASSQFHAVHGFFPRITAPVGFNEWVTWRKFLDPFKVPESGNKLLTHTYLTAARRERVRCARVLWRSFEPKLPDNDGMPPGRYFLKASHGAGLNGVITYPLRTEARKDAERIAAQWLTLQYGLSHGEWWYSMFRPELFLEEYLGEDRFAINCFCFRGEVALIVVHWKRTKETITMMPDLRVIGHVHGSTDIGLLCSREQLMDVCALASTISMGHPFMRVDFLIAQSGEPILGEITLTPGNALSVRPTGIDEYLGRAWAKVYE